MAPRTGQGRDRVPIDLTDSIAMESWANNGAKQYPRNDFIQSLYISFRRIQLPYSTVYIIFVVLLLL